VRLPPGPAWTRYSHGPWPPPHDPVFDFTSTPTQWSWLDTFAREAADELLALRSHDALVIGHGDWYDGNARFDDGQVVAVFDWDLMVETEAVLVGLAAGGYLTAGAPSPSEAAAFVHDVEDARGAAFTATQRRAASAAGRWVLAFNARCELSNLGNRAYINDDEIPDSHRLAGCSAQQTHTKPCGNARRAVAEPRSAARYPEWVSSASSRSVSGWLAYSGVRIATATRGTGTTCQYQPISPFVLCGEGRAATSAGLWDPGAAVTDQRCCR
jgi:Phosphotransferase enzyme family